MLEVRFGMLSCVREYAARKLQSSEEQTSTVIRHAAHMAQAGCEWVSQLSSEDGPDAASRLEAERENLSAVVHRVFEPPFDENAVSAAMSAVEALDALHEL